MSRLKSRRAAIGACLFACSLFAGTGCDEQQLGAMLAGADLSAIDFAALVGGKLDAMSAQLPKNRVTILPETVSNIGPMTFNARSGAIGLRGAGTAFSYNPNTREVCAGVGSSLGAAGYGRGAIQACIDPNGTSLKGTIGVGGGIGADVASVGVTQGFSATVRLPSPRRAPITGVVEPSRR